MTVLRLPEPFNPPQSDLAFIGGSKGARLYAMPTQRQDRFGATLTFLLEDKNCVINAFEQLDGDCGDDPLWRQATLDTLKAWAVNEVETAFRLHGDKIFPLLK